MNFIHLLDFPSRKNLFEVPHSFSISKWVWKTSGTSWNLARKLSHFTTSSEFPTFSQYPNIPFFYFYLFIFLFFVKKNYFCLPWICARNKRVCIDLSCWMVQLQNVNKSHPSIKDKLYLKGLFHRLRALIALNCSLIFVTGICIFHFVCLQFWLQM